MSSKMIKNKKSDKKIVDQLILDNLHLVKEQLNESNCANNIKEDVMQEGILLLTSLINEYVNSNIDCSLPNYLENNLRVNFQSIINKNKNQSKLYFNNSSYTNDFQRKIEDNEIAEKLKMYILNTNELTFMQRTVLMAKLGFINDYEVSFKNLADSFNCTYSNIHAKYVDSVGKLSKVKNLDKKCCEFNGYPNFFDYFNTCKEVVLDTLKTLPLEEVKLLKMVWKDDFSSMNDPKNINMSEDEIKQYYNVIGKLSNYFNDLEITDELMNRLGISCCYVLKK